MKIIISKPDYIGIIHGFVPGIPNSDALCIGIGIIRATIMPHNLYLHSSIVQTRNINKTEHGLKQAIKFNNLDSLFALNLAFLVNAGILILAASVFHRSGNYGVDDILQTHKLLEPILGNTLAPILFGIALIAAGQSSTITGTYAGQIVMEGFINLRIQPWVRRLITRIMAIIPSIFVIIYFGDSSTANLLILNQVILSLQLSFAIVPLIHFVSSKIIMKGFVISIKTKIIAWILSALIITLNIKLVVETLKDWITIENTKPLTYIPIFILCFVFGLLLMYIIFEPIINGVYNNRVINIHGKTHFPKINKITSYNKIALALDFTKNNGAVLSHAVNLAKQDTILILIHVIESAGASIYGTQVNDRKRLNFYVEQLTKLGIKNSIYEVGYGKAEKSIAEIVEKQSADLLILITYGHKGITDILFETVTDKVKHKITIPILIAR
ncbi:divalent metal cation transporter [Clostridium tyrobutyricum]|uniref:divalent metal cation transporter n=1 Tax=Clostridium tyrobutyricum TaxID=1519 RepID=UPI0030D4DD4C